MDHKTTQENHTHVQIFKLIELAQPPCHAICFFACENINSKWPLVQHSVFTLERFDFRLYMMAICCIFFRWKWSLFSSTPNLLSSTQLSSIFYYYLSVFSWTGEIFEKMCFANYESVSGKLWHTCMQLIKKPEVQFYASIGGYIAPSQRFRSIQYYTLRKKLFFIEDWFESIPTTHINVRMILWITHPRSNSVFITSVREQNRSYLFRRLTVDKGEWVGGCVVVMCCWWSRDLDHFD